MKAHEAIAAQLMELGSHAARALSERLGGDYKVAFFQLAEFLRAGAKAIAIRHKTVADLCDEMGGPRKFVEPDTEADRPSAKKREREE